MRLACNCLTFAMLLGLMLSPAVVCAQDGSGRLSDFLELTITDQNGVDVISPMVFPFVEPPVAPDPGEPATIITVPGVTVDFMELSGTVEEISDRFQIGPLDVTVESADLVPRSGAKLIPGSALERFLPMRIVAFSDAESAAGTGVSDTLRIFQGGYSDTLGELVYDEMIQEPPSETMPETMLSFVTPPAMFDVEEPLFETGGVARVISDYVDLAEAGGFFISSDNPADYVNLPPMEIHVRLIEDPELGGTMIYTLRFVSDVVPEPGSVTLVVVGCGLLLGVVRRCR
jgi:hypothetical protein